MAVGLFAAMVVMVLTLLGIGTRYYFKGDHNVIHGLSGLFYSINLLICYWEICLYFKRDYIETRTEYWRGWQRDTGRTPSPASRRPLLVDRYSAPETKRATRTSKPLMPWWPDATPRMVARCPLRGLWETTPGRTDRGSSPWSTRSRSR